MGGAGWGEEGWDVIGCDLRRLQVAGGCGGWRWGRGLDSPLALLLCLWRQLRRRWYNNVHIVVAGRAR